MSFGYWGIHTAADRTPPHSSSLPSVGHCGNNEWGEGLCGHLALAFKNMYPDMKIAAEYDPEDNTVNHAWAYGEDGRSHDFMGTHNYHPLTWRGSDFREDVDPEDLAADMDIDYDPNHDRQWENHEVAQAGHLINRHWLGDDSYEGDDGYYDPEQAEDRGRPHTASTDGIRYAHVVEADVAEDLRRLAAVNQDLVDRLKGEFHAWRRQQPKGSIYPEDLDGLPIIRHAAVADPTDVFVQRLRDLNHRHRIHNSRHPVPDRVIAKYPPLSEQEEQHRQQMNARQRDLDQRWDDMAPMTDDEVALHTRLNPMAHQHDDLENLPDRRKARYFAALSNPQFLQGGPRTKREQHHYDTLKPWADQYFGGMQQQAKNDLKRWDDYHAKGYHWNGNSTLEGDEEAHALHNTADWGAEMTRQTYDTTPVRDALPVDQYIMLRKHADAHRKALEEMAEHGPLHYNPDDRRTNTYAYQNVEDTRNRLHVELQHRKVFTPRDLDDLPHVAHPKEAHAEGTLVNPRHTDGLTPGGIYQTYADQRAFQINCQRCVLAAEARHRGYNVEAARNYQPIDGVKNHPDNDQEFPDQGIAAWFTDPATGRPARWQDAEDLPDPTWQPDDLSDLTDKQREQFLRGIGGAQQPTKVRDNPDLHHWDVMHDHIASWGPGARGIVAVTYKSASGATKRHVLSAHVRDNGTVHYFDPQDGTTGQQHEWRDRVDYAGSRDDHRMARDNAALNPIKGIGTAIHNKYYSPLRVLRVDNQDLHPSVARNVVSRGTAPDEPLRPTLDASF